MVETSGSRVCVIGAGIAGLVTAKVLREDGFDVVIFEREATLGGVWTASRTYPGLRANNPRETYAFSDYPYPETADEFPTAEDVRAYLNSYTDQFGLRPHMRLGTRVLEVRRRSPKSRGHAGFEVVVRPVTAPAEPEKLHFDFVAVCNGTFSEPLVPEIEGAACFRGRICHSSGFVRSDDVERMRIAVVGAGKSALDCASWAAQHARSSTLIYRRPHWMVPRYLFGFIRADYLFLTRFFEAFLRYHRPSRLEAVLHGPGKRLVSLWWNGLSRLLRRQVGMPPGLVPNAQLPAGFGNVGVGEDFYSLLREGKLKAKCGRVANFTESGIALDSGERIDADVVVLATGWRQSLSFLDPELCRLVDRDGSYHLYRHVLPPEEPRLGFVGYASSIACQLTSELSAHWLSQCFRGELQLPSVSMMDDEIWRVQRWVSEVLPGRPQAYYVGPFLTHYIDELMRDMGLRTKRTGNFLTEYFGPVWSNRYKTLATERSNARDHIQGRTLPHTTIEGDARSHLNDDLDAVSAYERISRNSRPY